MATPEPEADEDANMVHLRGRLAAAPEVRELPSGDEITVWRVIVPRTTADTRPRSDGRKGAGIDTLDCSAWRPKLRRQIQNWQAQDIVEIDGTLQRRFYRQAGNLVSRHEIVARKVRRVSRAERAAST